MAQNNGPVVVTLNCEAHPAQDEHEIERAEWDAMTPAERLALVQTLADEHVTNAGGYGWYIADPGDEAAVGADLPDATDPLRELAEWLVSLDDPEVRRDLPYHLSDVAAVVLAARARAALGKEG